MNVIIAEGWDVSLTERLAEMVLAFDPSIRIVARYDSVQELITYFLEQHGRSALYGYPTCRWKGLWGFNQVNLLTPVIFTTMLTISTPFRHLSSIASIICENLFNNMNWLLHFKNSKCWSASQTLTGNNQWDVLKNWLKIPVNLSPATVFGQVGQQITL